MNIGIEYINEELIIISNNKIFKTIDKKTLDDFQVKVFSKEEMIEKIKKDLEFIPVSVIIKKNENLLNDVQNSKDELFILDENTDVVFSNDLNSEFNQFIQELIDFSNSSFKFLTLIDSDEVDTTNKNGEFIYAQIRLRLGEIDNDILIKKILELELTDEDMLDYYTREDLIELNPYSVLLNHFTLRKDAHRIPISEY
jgi:hypothetical protein